MGPLGLPELLFILVLALLIFGPRRLPQIGRTLGKAMGEFRRATSDLTRTLNAEVALDEERSRRPAPGQPKPQPAPPPDAGEAQPPAEASDASEAQQKDSDPGG